MLVELCEATTRQDIQLTQKIQQELTKLYDLVTDCLTKRPGISTLFHIVNIILQKRGVCQNIMLEHEGDCPDWLKLKAGEIDEFFEAY